MRIRTIALVLLPGVIAGCGSGETKTVTETRTVTVTETTPTEVPASEEGATSSSQGDDIGKTKTSGGIKLRLISVRSSRKLRLQGGTQTESTPNGEPRTIRAKQGGRYVFVRTRITNDTKASIDITCGAPITAQVGDKEERLFDPVDELYLVKGNPGCNEKLQPGFKTTMTWPFLIPEGTRVVAFGFQDTSDMSGSEEEAAAFALPPTP